MNIRPPLATSLINAQTRPFEPASAQDVPAASKRGGPGAGGPGGGGGGPQALPEGGSDGDPDGEGGRGLRGGGI